MVPLLKHERTSTPKRWLAGYCFLTLAATLVLLYAGGFTTTIGAGMVFPDWPLSNGSLNPPGWTTDQAMLAEHGHRLLGAVVGTLCIVLCLWMWRREERRWLRRLSYAALALVIFQGLLGGARVLFVSLNLAKVHGITAQIFLCTLTAVAVGSSAWWRGLDRPDGHGAQRQWTLLRRTGLTICGLTMVQLLLGTLIRHRGAGLSIPYFPHSAPDGGLLPLSWNWATTLHFSHRVVAVLLTILFFVWLMNLWRSGWVSATVKKLAVAGAVLLVLQILLGAGIIWSARAPIQTTLHVLNGAIFLSIGWAVTFSFFKPELEPSSATWKTG
ncbi:MAG: cytochrome oxidase assembly protein [Verrucomicrobia bacterium]|jgi:cytochrome c oxidase assembly protein subunit 15|nr:cytochrome oxidase assembly protein [Verrucomicrobiota bacterium]